MSEKSLYFSTFIRPPNRGFSSIQICDPIMDSDSCDQSCDELIDATTLGQLTPQELSDNELICSTAIPWMPYTSDQSITSFSLPEEFKIPHGQQISLPMKVSYGSDQISIGIATSHKPHKEQVAVLDGMNAILFGKTKDRSGGFSFTEFQKAITDSLFPILVSLQKEKFYETCIVSIKPMTFPGYEIGKDAGRFIQLIYRLLSDTVIKQEEDIDMSKIRFLLPVITSFEESLDKARDDRAIIRLSKCVDADITVVTRDKFRDMSGEKMQVESTFAIFTEKCLEDLFFFTLPKPIILSEKADGSLYDVKLFTQCDSGTCFRIPASSFTSDCDAGARRSFDLLDSFFPTIVLEAR